MENIEVPLQHSPKHGNGLIPEPMLPAPARYHFTADRYGISNVSMCHLSPPCETNQLLINKMVDKGITFSRQVLLAGKYRE